MTLLSIANVVPLKQIHSSWNFLFEYTAPLMKTAMKKGFSRWQSHLCTIPLPTTVVLNFLPLLFKGIN